MGDVVVVTAKRERAEYHRAYRQRRKEGDGGALEQQRQQQRYVGRKALGVKVRGKSGRDKLTPFVGLDGEGWEVDGKHAYTLLRVGEYELYNDGEALEAMEVFNFLLQVARVRKQRKLKPGNWVGYYLGYDVNMWLRTIPPHQLKMLLAHGQAEITLPFPEDFPEHIGRFGVAWVPGKIFRLRRFGLPRPGMRHVWDVVIHDASGFYQASFVKALQDWGIGTVRQRDYLASMKAKRGDFSPDEVDSIRRYNALECRMLEQLMDEFRSTCRDTNMMPKGWYGAGVLAVALLQQNGMDKHIGPDLSDDEKDAGLTRGIKALLTAQIGQSTMTADELLETVLRAYFGGRAEIVRAGFVDGVHEYDIASAYPDVTRRLPCMAPGHGQWSEDGGLPVEGDGRSLVHVTWDVPMPRHQVVADDGVTVETCGDGPEILFAPFPFRRSDGSLWYPLRGAGVYWDKEVRTAVGIWGADRIQVGRVITYRPTCECAPFAWVEERYEERLRLGKTKRGKPIKIGLASVYGKSAQAIGRSPFQSPVWAGIVTSDTRARMLGLAALAGPRAAGIMTDALYTEGALDVEIPVGRKAHLGELEHEELGRFFFVQPGFGWVSPRTEDLLEGGGEERRTIGEELRREAEDDAADTEELYQLQRDIGMLEETLALDPAGAWRDRREGLDKQAQQLGLADAGELEDRLAQRSRMRADIRRARRSIARVRDCRNERKEKLSALRDRLIALELVEHDRHRSDEPLTEEEYALTDNEAEPEQERVHEFKMRNRGVARSRLTRTLRAGYERLWSENGWQHFEFELPPIPHDVFIGVRLALARHKPEIAGTWEYGQKKVVSFRTEKRVFPVDSPLHLELSGRSIPITTVPPLKRRPANVLSAPYDRFAPVVRAWADDKAVAEDQPDPSSHPMFEEAD